MLRNATLPIRHSRESGNPLLPSMQVCADRWIPAFAGMTKLLSQRFTSVERWASFCSAQPTQQMAPLRITKKRT